MQLALLLSVAMIAGVWTLPSFGGDCAALHEDSTRRPECGRTEQAAAANPEAGRPREEALDSHRAPAPAPAVAPEPAPPRQQDSELLKRIYEGPKGPADLVVDPRMGQVAYLGFNRPDERDYPCVASTTMGASLATIAGYSIVGGPRERSSTSNSTTAGATSASPSSACTDVRTWDW